MWDPESCEPHLQQPLVSEYEIWYLLQISNNNKVIQERLIPLEGALLPLVQKKGLNL